MNPFELYKDRLAQGEQISHADVDAERINRERYDNRMIVTSQGVEIVQDGNAFCANYSDGFTNIQESYCAFGGDPLDALLKLVTGQGDLVVAAEAALKGNHDAET